MGAAHRGLQVADLGGPLALHVAEEALGLVGPHLVCLADVLGPVVRPGPGSLATDLPVADFLLRVDDRVGRLHPHHDVGVAQQLFELLAIELQEVADRLRGRGLAVEPLVDDPPEPAAGSVTARVLQVDLVMADDLVVKVVHIERAVRPELDVGRAEPEVVTAEEVGLQDRLGRRAGELDLVEVDLAGDHVAEEHHPLVFLGEMVGLVPLQPAQAGRVVVVADHVRPVAQAVVRLAEALVNRPADQLGHRTGMAVGVVEVEVRVVRHAERVDLAAGEDLNARAVGTEADRVAAVERDLVAVLALHLGIVREAVAGVDPAVRHQGEGVDHPVRVADAERPEQFHALVGLAVAVGVGQLPDETARRIDRGVDAGNNDALAIRQRQHADRDVQFVGEGGHLAGLAVLAKVVEDHQLVPAVLAHHRPGVLQRGGDPQPAHQVERHLHRLVNRRLRHHQLRLEARRELERLALLLRRQGVRRRDGRLGKSETGNG